jgi:DNA-binding transcriptional ArsR family regulator
MRNASLILILFAMTSPAVMAEGTPFHFAVPAQANGSISTLNATWALVAIADEGNLEAQFNTTTPSQEQNITQTVVDGIFLPISSTKTRSLAPFHAELANTAPDRSSIYLSGPDLTLDTQGMAAQIMVSQVDDCADSLAGSEESLHYLDARYYDLCPAVEGAFLLLKPTTETANITIDVDDLQKAEWHNLESRCSTSSCPATSRREIQHSSGPLWNVTTGSFGFTHLEMEDSTFHLKAQPRMVLVGGPDIDLLIEGWLRMPRAEGGACRSCIADGATLQTMGSISLEHLRPTEDGRLAGVLGGDLQTARADEAGIDPAALFGNLPAVAAVTAATVGIVLLAKILFGALFTRMTGEEALEHPNRKRLVEHIQKDPGINFRGLVRVAGIAAGTARHHLTILVRAGVVTEQGFGATRRFFAGHAGGDWEHKVLLREPGLRHLHGWVAANPGATQMQALDAMAAAGWSRSTTQHRLQRLCEGGALEARWQGRYKRYWAAGSKAALAPLAQGASVGPGSNAAS